MITLLVENNEEYKFFSRFQIIKFATEDKIIDLISNMGIIMIPHAIVFGEIDKIFLSDHYKFIESKIIENVNLLHNTEDSVDPYDHHELKFGGNAFTETRLEGTFSFYRSGNEDI